MFHFRTLLFSLILTFSISQITVFAQEGEIILGGEEYITDKSNADEGDRTVEPPMPDNTMKTSPVKEKNETRKEKKNFDLDDFIDREIDRLLEEMKVQLTLEIKMKIKNEILNIIKKYKKRYSKKELKSTITYKIKIKIEHEYKKTAKVKRTYKKKRPTKRKRIYRKSKWTNVEITNVKVGKDRQRVEKIENNSPLPISITVKSTRNMRQGELKVYAKNLETGKSFLIYKIDQFRLNRKWAQDQFVWKGKYIDNGEKADLESGIYAVICIMKIEDKASKKPRIITRAWGKGFKDYYVTIKSSESTEEKAKNK